MDSKDIQFHVIVLGLILSGIAIVTVLFSRQGDERKQLFFHYLFGLLSFGTLVLIFVGAMVASTRSGMAFMDWPTSNGLIWPGLDQWVHQKDMFWEHLHRLIAQGIGVLGICSLIWSFFVFDRKYVKACAVLLVLIVLQGIFGALTVKKLTVWWASTLHAVVAQVVFSYMLVVFYSTGNKVINLKPLVDNDSWLRSIPKIVCALVMIQLLLGASFRHKMKVAQFASDIDTAAQSSLKTGSFSLSPAATGTFNVQIKTPAPGYYSVSLSEKLTLSREVTNNANEFVSIGHLSLAEGEEYKLNTIGNITDIRIVGPERFNVDGGKEEQLPFVIVYKEVLDGNRHLLWAHIVFAVIVTCFVLFLGVYLWKKKESLAILKWPAICLIVTITVQIFLGLVAFVTVSERQENIYDQVKTILTSAHLANGALLFACCVLALFLCRRGFVKSVVEE